jgi:hypothetical protein
VLGVRPVDAGAQRFVLQVRHLRGDFGVRVSLLDDNGYGTITSVQAHVGGSR